MEQLAGNGSTNFFHCSRMSFRSNMAEEACTAKRQLGDRRSLLVSLGQQIKSLLALGRLEEATSMLEKGMVELTATIGYYAMLACTLNTFDVHTFTPPEDLKI